jgi:hypothetical protein
MDSVGRMCGAFTLKARHALTSQPTSPAEGASYSGHRFSQGRVAVYIDGCFWHGPDQQVDQYRALAEVFLRRRPGAAANEFRATVDEIAALVSEMD